MTGSSNPALSSDPSIGQVGYKVKSKAVGILSQSWAANCTSSLTPRRELATVRLHLWIHRTKLVDPMCPQNQLG